MEYTDLESSDNIKNSNTIKDYFKLKKNESEESLISLTTQQILESSSLRCRKVSLNNDWYKINSEPMLGKLKDGTEVALLPHKIGGYCIYNPRTDTKTRVTAKTAKLLEGTATAVYPVFLDERITLKYILSFSLKQSFLREFIIIMLVGLLTAILQVIPPLMSEQIFDMIIPENMHLIMVEYVLIIVVFSLTSIVLSVVMNIVISRISIKIFSSLHNAIWDRLLRLNHAFYYKHNSKDITNRIKGLETIKKAFNVENITAVVFILFSFVNIIVLFRYNARITLFALLMLFILLAISTIINLKKIKIHSEFINASNSLSAFTYQVADGIERITASCAKNYVYNRFNILKDKKVKLKNKIQSIEAAQNALYSFARLFSIAVIYFLIYRYSVMDVGGFIAYVATFSLLQGTLISFLRVLNCAPEIISAYKSLTPILISPIESTLNKPLPQRPLCTLEVSNLSFCYDECGKLIIDNLSFSVSENETIGILGSPGSGKSTLFKLLIGFLNPTEGKIHYGGYDLSAINTTHLRERLGILMDSNKLTSGSVYDNITLYDDTINPEKVIFILKKLGIYVSLELLPQGLNTFVKDCILSPKEIKLILIARILLQKKGFIILDEPFLHLDTQQISTVLSLLNEITATKIIFAEDPSRLINCDRSIKLE